MGDETTWLLPLIGVMLVGYFALTTWLGKKGKAHSGSMKGFAIAKGKVNPAVVGMSFGASYASANLFLGVPGWAYTYGLSTLWYTIGCFGVTWLGLLLFTKTFWRYGQKNGGSLTIPQWLGNRYNSKALRVLVALLVLFNIYYIVGQNVGLATMFETVIGIPYLWGIAIGVIITVVYVSLGGGLCHYYYSSRYYGRSAADGMSSARCKRNFAQSIRHLLRRYRQAGRSIAALRF
ncbi:hypothetical protein ON064_14885 [Planococcus sp. A6]|uniref:sodium:solute symporter family transporter n=1 Tax=Planococcus sp. A6 TaxID=2992760 RepID=UPI00237B1008|nr:hypothetical protein [Planococcus sp. A6]MDE0584311.1 hypothetical protein [Planococcus sp. A6]